MPPTDRVFAGAIPDLYDTLLVPLIFKPYADDLARRIARLEPAAVLETAAGTGVVPRALAPLLRSDASYVVTDLAQPMLDRARSRQPPDTRIVWRQADAMHPPFEDAQFDVVCCQFGVMFLPDRVAGFREALRTLRPGGRFIFSSWDRIEENAFADTVTRAAAAAFPDDPPGFLARLPHGYHDVDRIRADVTAAGFGSVEIDTVEHQSTAADPLQPAIAYCQGTPLRSEIEARSGMSLEEVTHRAGLALASEFGPGPIAGRIQAHVVTAAR